MTYPQLGGLTTINNVTFANYSINKCNNGDRDYAIATNKLKYLFNIFSSNKLNEL